MAGLILPNDPVKNVKKGAEVGILSALASLLTVLAAAHVIKPDEAETATGIMYAIPPIIGAILGLFKGIRDAFKPHYK